MKKERSAGSKSKEAAVRAAGAVRSRGEKRRDGVRRLAAEDYRRDAVTVAKALLGATLCRRLGDGTVLRRRITETEAYFGEEDTACHAHRGRTPRTDAMYAPGGRTYVYLCYGMHEMLNVVTGPADHPEAVLVRGVEGAEGPGRLTKLFAVDRSLNREDLVVSDRLWIETDGRRAKFTASPRVGIAYASKRDQSRKWRFSLASPDEAAVVDVVGAVIRDGERVLLAQRPEGKAQAGLWEFPGGKIEPGETPERALARECREELAVSIEAPRRLVSVVHRYPERTIRLILLECRLAPGSVPVPQEHQQVAWVPPAQIPAMNLCPADRELLPALGSSSRLLRVYGGGTL